jgi:FkbM family methyltransferase
VKYHSQIEQDKYFIENILPTWKRSAEDAGRFLDVGAYDGVHTSNTLTLEQELGWTGVLIEANPVLAMACQKNRPNSVVHEAVVWSSVLELDYEYPGSKDHLLSRVANLPHNKDYFKEDFKTRDVYRVRTRTLSSLLGPGLHRFDYGSFDVEGAELEALRGINWYTTTFRFLTVEYGDRQDYLNELIAFLSGEGYQVHRINQFDVEFVPINRE